MTIRGLGAFQKRAGRQPSKICIGVSFLVRDSVIPKRSFKVLPENFPVPPRGAGTLLFEYTAITMRIVWCGRNGC